MIETGRKTVRLDTLWKLADALSTRPSDLLAACEPSP